MFRPISGALLCAALAAPVMAQSAAEQSTAATQIAPAAAPIVAQPTALRLPANTSLTLALNAGLSTKTFHAGDKFSLTVVQDVMAGDRVVIPHGTRAVGQVNWATGNGGFGKSGKIELVFRYVELGSKEIPVDGRYYQEGNGNTAGTIGAVMGAGIVGGLIVHGHSAEVPQGREFTVTTSEDLPLVVGAVGGEALIDPSYAPKPVSMQVETEKERKARLKREKREHNA